MREEELVTQMVKLVDKIGLNKISMREKFEAEGFEPERSACSPYGLKYGDINFTPV